MWEHQIKWRTHSRNLFFFLKIAARCSLQRFANDFCQKKRINCKIFSFCCEDESGSGYFHVCGICCEKEAETLKPKRRRRRREGGRDEARISCMRNNEEIENASLFSFCLNLFFSYIFHFFLKIYLQTSDAKSLSSLIDRECSSLNIAAPRSISFFNKLTKSQNKILHRSAAKKTGASNNISASRRTAKNSRREVKENSLNLNS